MATKEEIKNRIQEFKRELALDGPDENVIVTIHLMSTHCIDKNSAHDQTSIGGDDNGIDGYFYKEENNELFIYQSKLSESKNVVLEGYSDLNRAAQWLSSTIEIGTCINTKDNKCLYNLAKLLAKTSASIKKINFILLSIFDAIELKTSEEFKELEKNIMHSTLNSIMKERNGKITLKTEGYNCEEVIPNIIKEYEVTKLTESTLNTTKQSRLDLVYISLYSLIDLYRQRNEALFNKNIRLSIKYSKDAKLRLVHPMRETLDLICGGSLDTNFFAFYHVGVTISAARLISDNLNKISLEDPSVVNGCQTITIANDYLKDLENKNKEEMINRFKEIKVIAKIVTGTSDDELREITNCNNRQSPIDNWQLFSNEPVHIAMEDDLKKVGIFYERQKGKFEALSQKIKNITIYENTNNTYLKVEELGKLICFAKRKLQWAAKPSEIFVSKIHHEMVFDYKIGNYQQDIVFLFNFFKGVSNALTIYLKKPIHKNDNSHKIFSKPYIKSNLYYLGLIYAYQNPKKFKITEYQITRLFKKASSPITNTYCNLFYPKSVTRFKQWYIKKSKNLEDEVTGKEIDTFIEKLANDMGINLKYGAIPISSKSRDWNKFFTNEK